MVMEAGSALLIVFLGLWTVQGLSEPSWNERMNSCRPGPALQCQDYLRNVFMLVFTEALERLISFPRVRELNGRIRILKSGIVPTRPCFLLDFHRYVN